MSEPLSTNTLVSRHATTYLPSHCAFPTFAELAPLGKLPHFVVVTCADPRCIPENFLSTAPGEIIVIRNVGGNIAMALPNILALDTLVGINEIMVVKHTDCGSLAFTNASVKDVLKERVPIKREEIEEMEFGSIAGKTLDEAVKEQIGAAKGSDLLREGLKTGIRGFVYDLHDGSLEEVEV